MQLGVDRFDTSVGGLGGSPFAAGAAGNLATEELVAVLDDLGVRTGIDVERLLDAAAVAVRAGRTARAEPRRRRSGPGSPPRPEEPDRALVRRLRPLLQPELARRRRHLPDLRPPGGRAPAEPPEKLRRFSDEPAPWHFKVLVGATAVYLGWRALQGIDWVAHHALATWYGRQPNPGPWRSLVSALDWGSRGRRFESPRPDRMWCV